MATKSIAAQTHPHASAEASKAKKHHQPSSSPLRNDDNSLKYKIPVINNIGSIKTGVKYKALIINKMHNFDTIFSGCDSPFLRLSRILFISFY